MPAPIPSARRSGVVRAAVVAAVAALLGGCGGGSSAIEQASSDTAPLLELRPEDGVVRTTVVRPSPPASTAPTPDPSDEVGDVLLIGDSVLVLVLDDLAARLRSTLHVDGADCRQLGATVTGPCGGVPDGVQIDSGLDALVAARQGERRTPESAVLVLANNSSITPSELDTAMEAAAGIDHVWWVNARIEGFGRQDVNNRLLAELAAGDPRAGVIDWYGASEGRNWLADNVHPDDAGQAALADLIEERLRCRCTA